MQRVGFIGLGRMGGPCVRNLLKKGYEVRIWARSPEKARHLVEAGAVLCGSPAAAAAEADIFLTCVTAGPDVEDILLGEDGVCRGRAPRTDLCGHEHHLRLRRAQSGGTGRGARRILS